MDIASKEEEKKSYCTCKIDGENLLVYSKTSGRLYGFDEIGASLFFFLEADRSSKEELLQSIGQNNHLDSVISTISAILDDEKSFEIPECIPSAFDYPEINTSKNGQTLCFRLDTFVFVIDSDVEMVKAKILPSLYHLKCECSKYQKVAVNIGFLEKDARWSIGFNGKEMSHGLAPDELLPRLLDLIRISYYRSTDYLISLHAGALYYNRMPLIMPAASGSGKSTLTAYLMKNNFVFLTDEVATIGKNASIRPIPMAVTIKEGSWKVLEDHGIFLNDLLIHMRFDGQRLRFLPPENIAEKSMHVDGAYLIFPRYVEGESTKVEPITTLQALTHITVSGYEVKDSYDEATIRQWIGLVETMKKYTITYSDLEDARQNIERLMRA